MGRAIEMGVREQHIALKQAGCSLLAISEQLHLGYGRVCRLSAHLKVKGELYGKLRQLRVKEALK